MTPVLSIVIPFLNEGYEVENTLISIFDHSDMNDIEVIIINDASDDGYNYSELLSRYRIRYVENPVRMGVATSRDKGAELACGKFIVFLDAHMRFYDYDWSKRIIDILSSEERLLLCSQSKGLYNINNEVCEIKGHRQAYGASINFINNFRYLECDWRYRDLNPTENLIEIPCVFGACYAVSKRTWQHIKGLAGLSQYGNDETYMSMKIWLSGGKVKLIKDLFVGHIYRKNQPYQVDIASRIFNRLWIASLLLDSDCHSIAFSYSKRLKSYNKSLSMLFERKDLFIELYRYYKSTFHIPFIEFVEYNYAHSDIKNKYHGTVEIIEKTKNFILKYYRYLSSFSLEDGKLGAILFLAIYTIHSQDNDVYEYVNQYIDELIQNDSDDLSLYDMLDLGWTLSFLFIKGVVKEEVNNELIEGIIDKIYLAKENVITDFVLFNNALRLLLAISNFLGCSVSCTKISSHC